MYALVIAFSALSEDWQSDVSCFERSLVLGGEFVTCSFLVTGPKSGELALHHIACSLEAISRPGNSPESRVSGAPLIDVQPYRT